MTLQWMIASEALNRSLHHKGEHAMATSLRDCFGNTTVYHIIYTISRNRHPTIGALKKGERTGLWTFATTSITIGAAEPTWEVFR